MTLDDKIARAKELIGKREEIDAELSTLLAGNVSKRQVRCSLCNAEGHTARSCPQKPAE